MQAFVFWIAVGFSCALGACVLVGLLCKTGEKLRTLWRCGWALVVAAAVAIIHGGTKNITNRFTADSGLTVVKAEINVATNEVDNTTLDLSWVGPDEYTPIYVRNSPSETWRLLQDVDGWYQWDPRWNDGGTNFVGWMVSGGVAASNVTVWAQWYIGTDLPPVEIEGDGISILDFRDTSTNVVMTYTVERAVLGDNAGTVRVEMQEDSGAVWMEVRWDAVYGGATNTVTIPGFWIGRDTRWRVRLEVDQ